MLQYKLTFVRHMGGGPRTFPGGLNKWQWKRMHEKKAREKEKHLLQQEKQIYQARIRSSIRAKIDDSESPPQNPDQSQPNYSPLTPEQHIKALADRFMKEGAEDLWNEKDGPSGVPFSGEPINLQKLVSERSNFSGGVAKPRNFSTCAMDGLRIRCTNGFGLVGNHRHGILMRVSNLMNSNCYYSVGASSLIHKKTNVARTGEKSVTNDSSNTKERSTGGIRAKWGRFRGGRMGSSDDDSDEELESKGNIVRSSAALRDYDVKIIKKRVPLSCLEGEMDVSQQVEVIKEEVRMRKHLQADEKEMEEAESVLSTKRFGECDISTLTVQALTEAGYVQMTRVQEATLSAFHEGNDALVRARAGTGKSVAFLLPAIETVLKASSAKTVQRVSPIYVLILCPTRELASQISAEANVLLKHHEGIGVQTLVGGTRFKIDQKRLESEPCQILVATPGRLLDHIENKSTISARLMGLNMLVLDEADHLLDMGFRKDVEKIVDCLPRKRHSLLFSATIPREVRRISQLVLKREHAYVDTVGIGCLETSAKVKQSYLVAPHDQHFHIVHHLLKNHISEVPEYKVIIFCATAMMTSLMYSLLWNLKMNVREIHSRKPALYRTRISDEFKESKQLILITSDVSSRGLNYPDVTLVIQVGIAPDRSQYIHRLGRTGRQGKEGEGLLLLAPWEQHFLDEIKDLPLEKCSLPQLDPDAKDKIEESMGKVDTSIKEAAYHAWLGYYNSINTIARDKTTLVQLANQFSASIGLQNPPSLFRKTAIKMGLKDIPGILIRK